MHVRERENVGRTSGESKEGGEGESRAESRESQSLI